MHVKYGLSGGRIAVHHNPITYFTSSFFLRQLFGNKKQIADFLSIGLSKIVDGRTGAFRSRTAPLD